MPLLASIVIAIAHLVLQTLDEVLWAALAHIMADRSDRVTKATDRSGYKCPSVAYPLIRFYPLPPHSPIPQKGYRFGGPSSPFSASMLRRWY